MPLRAPVTLRRQAFSTSFRFQASTLPSQFYATSTQIRPQVSTAPKLGRIGRWYLPAMALIAASMVVIPRTFSSDVKALRETDNQIGFAIANAIEEHNQSQVKELSDAERHRLLMEAYGDRSSLEDMQKAMEIYEVQ